MFDITVFQLIRHIYVFCRITNVVESFKGWMNPVI